MSGFEVHGFAGDSEQVFRLAAALNAPAGLIDMHVFPDGEVLPSAPPSGAKTVILYRSLHHPNEWLVAVMLAADAYRRAGVSRLVLVAPYLPYLRQDAVFRPGQPLSRDVIGRWIGGAFDRVVTVQAHLHRTAELTEILLTPTQNLTVLSELARLIGGESPVIVGPDAEARAWVEAAAEAVGGDWITFDKQRLGDREVRLNLPPGARLRGRATVLLDDVCSTGGTLEQAIRMLRQAGAASVDVGVAHALFGPDVEARLIAAGAGRILSTDSIRHHTNALLLADLLASALRSEADR